ncbi:MAG: hypothetical protein ACE5IZ_01205, partial [Dehalococcoidia bacterium]
AAAYNLAMTVLEVAARKAAEGFCSRHRDYITDPDGRSFLQCPFCWPGQVRASILELVERPRLTKYLKEE